MRDCGPDFRLLIQVNFLTGKSTTLKSKHACAVIASNLDTLKDLRVKYAYEEWVQERAAWRSVIQLNLLQSVLTIVDTVRAELDDPVSFKGVVGSQEDSNASTSQSSIQFSESIRMLLLRLGPLRMVETELKSRLGAASEEVRAPDSVQATELYATPFDRPVSTKEFGVRRWKDILSAVTKPTPSDNRRVTRATVQAGARDQPTEIIASCREDMMSLWKNESVRAVLRKRKVYLEHTAGLYVKKIDSEKSFSHCSTVSSLISVASRLGNMNLLMTTYFERAFGLSGFKSTSSTWAGIVINE